MNNNGRSLKLNFINSSTKNISPRVITVAIKLPHGAIEVITNYEDISGKLEYYNNFYDSEFKLNSNPSVQIVGFMIV